MIAVLTACFIEAMTGKWRLGEEGIPPITKPLCNGRKSYAEVTLYRLESRAADITSNLVKNAVTDRPVMDKTEAEKADADKVGIKTKIEDESKTGDDAETDNEA